MIQHGASFIHPPLGIHPTDSDKFKIFLAGSIEMGAAEDWQSKVTWDVRDFRDKVIFMNPRRPDWDNTWQQSITDPNFKEQVNWELDMLASSDMVVFYFDPNTLSPISLLELGLYAATKKKVLVCCPKGYWRRGNIEVICDKYGIPLFESYEEWIEEIKKNIIW